ncbi:ATP-binding protein [Corynebacterium camporealensis]
MLNRHYKRLVKGLDPEDFTDAQAIAAIERLTRGNFRVVERLFPQIKRVLKINELETITDDVIEAAASTLVLGHCRGHTAATTACHGHRSTRDDGS